MVQFPLHFEIEATAKEGIGQTWETKIKDSPPVKATIPVEFGGPGDGYSPEDFFAMGVLNCIIATFKVYCEKGSLHFENLTSSAKATMGKHPTEHCLCITEIEISINVEGSSDADKVKKTLEHSIKECAISNSITSGKTFHLNVT